MKYLITDKALEEYSKKEIIEKNLFYISFYDLFESLEDTEDVVYYHCPKKLVIYSDENMTMKKREIDFPFKEFILWRGYNYISNYLKLEKINLEEDSYEIIKRLDKKYLD